MLRPDPLGIFDVLVAVLMYFTASPVPENFAMAHVGFLLLKGLGSMVKFPIFPPGFHILGGAADVVSAAILFTGNPPVFTSVKEIIAFLLFLKGGSSFLTFLG